MFSLHPVQRAMDRVFAGGDPHLEERYERLLRSGPVHRYKKGKRWVVVGWKEARTVLMDSARFSSSPSLAFDPLLMGAGEETHREVRPSFNRFIAGASGASFEDGVRHRVGELLGSLGSDEVDFVSRFAWPLPLRVVLDYFGIDATGPEAKEWSQWLEFIEEGWVVEEGKKRIASAVLKLQNHFISRRAKHPSANDAFSKLPPERAATILSSTLRASVTSTRDLIANTLVMGWKYPDVLKRVRADRSLTEAWIDEVARLCPPVTYVPRLTTEAVELGDVRIPAGAYVMVILAAANRDPSVFDKPHDASLERTQRSLTFSYGPHFCPGNNMAPLQAQIALAGLMDRFAEIVPARPSEPIPWRRGVVTRGPARLDVRCRLA